MKTELATTDKLTPDQIDLVKQNCCPGASDLELNFFLAVCSRTGLDPLLKQIYFVARNTWNNQKKIYEVKRTVQVSIDGLRLQAQRSNEYEGQTGPQWCGENGIWRDVWLDKEPPAAAKVGVFRKGFREPCFGIALWKEYAVKKKDGSYEQKWGTMPSLMLGKCSEGLAIRKAFPMETSGLYTQEESGHLEAEVIVESEPQKALEEKKSLENAPSSQTPVESVLLVTVRAALKTALLDESCVVATLREGKLLKPTETLEQAQNGVLKMLLDVGFLGKLAEKCGKKAQEGAKTPEAKPAEAATAPQTTEKVKVADVAKESSWMDVEIPYGKYGPKKGEDISPYTKEQPRGTPGVTPGRKLGDVPVGAVKFYDEHFKLSAKPVPEQVEFRKALDQYHQEGIDAK